MNVKQSVRPSSVFLALVALTVAGAVFAWLGGDSTEPLARGGVFVFVFAGWIVSLCLHEFGLRTPHGASAIPRHVAT